MGLASFCRDGQGWQGSAVAIGLRRSHEVAQFYTAHDLAEALCPSLPVLCIRPHAAIRAARWFVNEFRGKAFYAVKANPSPWLIHALWEGGIRQFDVASLPEIRQLREIVPDCDLAFMHPIKSPEAIREAYFAHGVRSFSLDTIEELEKIRAATDEAEDLTLLVRISVSSALAKISLSSKFGVKDEDAVTLIRETKKISHRFGLSFHVGSQAMAPQAFAQAIDDCAGYAEASGVAIDILDIGGGFPSLYPGMMPPEMDDYLKGISSAIGAHDCFKSAEIWSEPGRALAAEAASLVVRVEGRKGNILYFNDGYYGSLYDAGALGWNYPVQLLGRPSGEELVPYSAYGPTCDDSDYLPGPFILPQDIQVGDYVEIGMLGAYGSSMATGFNGFGSYTEIEVQDEPMSTMYGHKISNDNEEIESGLEGEAKQC